MREGRQGAGGRLRLSRREESREGPGFLHCCWQLWSPQPGLEAPGPPGATGATFLFSFFSHVFVSSMHAFFPVDSVSLACIVASLLSFSYPDSHMLGNKQNSSLPHPFPCSLQSVLFFFTVQNHVFLVTIILMCETTINTDFYCTILYFLPYIFPLSFPCQVRYVSDFFKQRPPPRCSRPETVETDGLERKPSMQMVDSEHNNHYTYPGSV